MRRLRDDAGVGGEDALDVGVDVTALGAERRGERYGGQVGGPAAQGGDVVLGGDALEAGDEHDLVAVERLVDPSRADVHDSRLPVLRVGDDPGLRACQRDGAVAEVVRRHRGERAGDALADGDEHVQLARIRPRGDLMRERDQLVGRRAHGREDGDDAVALLVRLHEPLGHAPEPLRAGNARPAELHHHGAALRVRIDRDFRDRLEIGDRRHISLRPVSARPSVTSSAYSRSLPTGSPLASRVTRTRPRRRSAR